MSTKRLWLGLLLALGPALPAAGSETMIRLGYTRCSTCHLSPQGGGLLTDYGKGIDLAQSIRVREYERSSDAQDRRFRQDLRVLLVAQHGTDGTPARDTSVSTDAQLWYRATGSLTTRQRLSSVLAIDGWPDRASSGHADPRVILTKALWEYRPIEGLELAIGRDALPNGLENPDYVRELRRVLEPGSSAFPTQAKLFWWTRRMHFTPYLFGPSGGEPREFRHFGAGALGGVAAFRHHAVLGLSVRASRTPTNDLLRFGGYARLGFGTWGILTEYEQVDRSPRASGAGVVRGSAGLTQVFFAPREWLVTSLGAEYIPVGTTGRHTYRLSPSAQIRVSDKVTFVIGERERFAESEQFRSRAFVVQLFLKTVERRSNHTTQETLK